MCAVASGFTIALHAMRHTSGASLATHRPVERCNSRRQQLSADPSYNSLTLHTHPRRMQQAAHVGGSRREETRLDFFELPICPAKSAVHAIDQSGQVYKGFYIWTSQAPAVKEDPDLCFAKCLVLPGSTPDVFKCKQVEPIDPEQQEFDVPSKSASNVNSGLDPMSFPDVGMIAHTNEAAALDFIHRYVKGQIYTEAKPLLMAVNPFKNLGNATDEIILQYRDAPDVEKLPPHVFAISRVALENLHAVHKSQTIIVSGELGAGKTEAVKQVMRYFAAAKSGTIDTRIQNAVLAANPVIEAFGNAKTIRNNNSSRFCRFMQLQVQAAGGIEFGRVNNFLLEKSRILTQESTERSYHIFYQLIKGATPEQRKQFKLRGLKGYKFINPECPDSPGIDDLAEWADVQKSFESMRISDEDKASIFSIVSGVLLLGNVEIGTEARPGVPDAACLDDANRALLKEACELLFLDPALVEEGIVTKISKAGGEEVRGSWKQTEAGMLKDSLSKGMYDKLFDWIVRKLNITIEPPTGFQHFMAMLDIFGFEVFKNNSLEQLFINITNEMLQKNFTDAVFDREQKLYREEGVSAADLVWTTNQEVMEVLTGKKKSLMTALEDQCLAPGGSDEKFLTTAHATLKGSPKLIKPKVGANINFMIEHTIGQISYNATGFLFKNKDVLRAELVEVVQRSPNPVAAGTFEGVVVERGKLAKGQLIGSQFLGQLNELMSLINMTEPHFIRCVKPNECKTPLKYVPSRVLVQLHSLSILEALQLRNLGYAYRRPFEQFLFQYRFINLGLANDTAMPAKERAEKMLHCAEIKEGWQIGKSMVFMKPAAMKQITTKQRECLAAWVPVVEVLEALWMKTKYRRQYDKSATMLARIQARCRQRLAGKVKSPSYLMNVKGWS